MATRISDHFALGRTQPTLDFVDVDIVGDTPLFVDPHALRGLRSQFGSECVSLVRHFFKKVLECIRGGDSAQAQQLLARLREPNETHLGLSTGRARGRGMGAMLASNVYDALSRSEAVQRGLLIDLEETALMVEGIDADIISDITTNIIRQPLIAYTQRCCALYGIPITPDVDSGPMWDPVTSGWFNEYASLPMVPGGKLLLVPKAIARLRLEYDADEYYRHYILEHLALEELNANTGLVELLKSGKRRVTKKALEEKYGRGKTVNAHETLRAPSLLEAYRHDKQGTLSDPLDHLSIAERAGSPPPDWDRLVADLADVPPGNEHSTRHERSIEALLSAILYPDLTNPIVQAELHEGRKRVDITYTNVAQRGFFDWLAQHYPASHVFVECKNYSTDIGNPELDQLSSRFAPSRGQFGIMVCRTFEKKDLFVMRCRDTAHDGRGYIIALDDGDLSHLAFLRKQSGYFELQDYLKAKFNALIM